MKFVSSGQERIFNEVLTIYEEEFGSENIVVVVPKIWAPYISYRKYHPITIKVWDHDIVGIRVDKFTAKYDMQV